MQTHFLVILTILVEHSFRNVLGGDKLALLSATLRTYQKAACYNDQIIIKCPRGTSIAIELAQYNKFLNRDGISVEEICRPELNIKTDVEGKAKQLFRGSSFHSQNTEFNETFEMSANQPEQFRQSHNLSLFNRISSKDSPSNDDRQLDCLWPNALQYSLLQTVVETCQKRKYCKLDAMSQYLQFSASLHQLNATETESTQYSNSNRIQLSDLCMRQKNIIEIAYKCRPYEFRSKVACHNDVAQLHCNPFARIAVYSASFGRTEYESIQCPQPLGVKEETCLAPYATEIIMQICHGRRRCNIAADANTFGSPCHPSSRMYLKVVFACVPKQVLKDHYESDIEQDESNYFDDNIDVYDEDLIYKEYEAEPKMLSNTTRPRNGSSVTGMDILTNLNVTSVNPQKNIHVAHFNDGGDLEGDQESLYLSLIGSGCICVLVCIILILIRAILQKQKHSSNNSTSPRAEEVVNFGNILPVNNGLATTEATQLELNEKDSFEFKEHTSIPELQKKNCIYTSHNLLATANAVTEQHRPANLLNSKMQFSAVPMDNIKSYPYLSDEKKPVVLYNCDNFGSSLGYCETEIGHIIPLYAEMPEHRLGVEYTRSQFPTGNTVVSDTPSVHAELSTAIKNKLFTSMPVNCLSKPG